MGRGMEDVCCLLSPVSARTLQPSHGQRFCACSKLGARYLPRMIQTLEAIVDEHGAVRLLEPLHLVRRHRALVTILADELSEAHETALLSEAALAEDWNRPEEDAAWSHLQ